METKFKYPVSYRCNSEEEYNELAEQLNTLGYSQYTNYLYSKDRPYILTDFGNFSNKYGANQTEGFRHYLCDSKELFIALASMRDSDEFFVGEYVKVIKTNYDYDHRIYKDIDIFQISEITKSKEYLRDKINGAGNGVHKSLCRKATKEEIIEFFTKNSKENIKETKMKFKVGDKVKIVKSVDSSCNADGDIGVVAEINNERTLNVRVKVRCKANAGNWETSENLELIEETNMNKEIIEYKVKRDYSKLSQALFEQCNHDTKGGWGRFDYDSNVKDFYKEAGVLDLWFEPIYKEEPKLEVGKWYKDKSGMIKAKYTGDDSCIGDYCCSWNTWCMSQNQASNYTLMTDSEIQELLIAGAKKRGYGSNTSIETICSGSIWNLGTFDRYEYDKVSDILKFYGKNQQNPKTGYTNNGWLAIYEKGKWAEIIPSIPKIVVNGYTAKFHDKYVKFGCAEFSREIFEGLLTLNSGMNASKITNREIKSIKLGDGQFTIDQIKQIVEYYQNK